MEVILIFAIILLYTLQTLFSTFYNKKFAGREDLASPVFCISQSAFIVLFTLVWMAFDVRGSTSGISASWIGFHFNPSLFTVLIGILNSFALFGYNTSIIKASGKGSFAFLNVALLFGGILIPAIYELFDSSVLEVHQYIAIVMMLASFVLMNYKDIKLKGSPLSYYLFCGGLFTCNGLYGTFLKIQSQNAPKESNEMVIITFGFMGIIALAQLLHKERANSLKAFKVGKSAMLPLFACLLVAALAIDIYMVLIPLLGNTVTILYTIDNGGVLILSAICSVIFFKEKIAPMKFIGIVLAVISIVALAVNAESIGSIKSLLA